MMLNQLFRKSLALVFVLGLSACAPAAPTPTVAAVEKEEQAVYAFFVSREHTPLILQETSIGISNDDPQQTVDYIKSSSKEVSNETLDNYLERNKQPSQLAPAMNLGVKYVLLSTDELAKISNQPNWNEILKEKYPDSNGYIIFSRVGFNNTLDQALIYVGNVAGPMMGSGGYYLMEKKDGQWIMKEQISAWIS